jgi:hypothetical protein
MKYTAVASDSWQGIMQWTEIGHIVGGCAHPCSIAVGRLGGLPLRLPLVLLQWYQEKLENQQDALRLTWAGIIAGTDGGVDWKNERMGAGYITGTALEPETPFSACVGGPLSTLRAEGASPSLPQLLLDLINELSTPLLVFVDCLVLLDILQRWGQVSFHPHPADVVHFDVIFPLLKELRRRTGLVRLVKVKSHTGCLLDERADEWAERGFHAEPPEICLGPWKYGSVWLGV